MTPIRIAATLLGVEAAAGIAAGVGFVIAALAGHPHDRATAVVLGVLLAVYGVGIGLVGRGVRRESRWARTPALLVQFFALVVAWGQRTTLTPVAVAVAVVAVLTAAALLRAGSVFR